jgi:hypothetical protein
VINSVVDIQTRATIAMSYSNAENDCFGRPRKRASTSLAARAEDAAC